MPAQRILITGAAGFIGSHLTRRLVKNGCEVHGLVHPRSNLWRIDDILTEVKLVTCDLVDYDPKLLEGIDVVYHLAAAGVDQSMPDEEAILRTNVMGTWYLMKYAFEAKVKRFVYCGSCFEYGQGTMIREEEPALPISVYGVSKSSGTSLAQMLFQNNRFPAVCLRPFTVYGPYESPHRLVPSLFKHILTDRDVELTEGRQTRDFVYVDDVVDAFVQAGTAKGIDGEIFNVSTGTSVTIRALTELVIRLAGSSITPLFGAKPYRNNELWELSGDPQKARTYLNWSAKTTLENGLTKTYRWFQEHGGRLTAIYG